MAARRTAARVARPRSLTPIETTFVSGDGGWMASLDGFPLGHVVLVVPSDDARSPVDLLSLVLAPSIDALALLQIAGRDELVFLSGQSSNGSFPPIVNRLAAAGVSLQPSICSPVHDGGEEPLWLWSFSREGTQPAFGRRLCRALRGCQGTRRAAWRWLRSAADLENERVERLKLQSVFPQP